VAARSQNKKDHRIRRAKRDAMSCNPQRGTTLCKQKFTTLRADELQKLMGTTVGAVPIRSLDRRTGNSNGFSGASSLSEEAYLM
jgi:hypothetical protein